jgi:hypothetical protein
MRIGIIGGWGPDGPHFQLTGERDAFERFCELLGHRLGTLGQGIIVGSDEDVAADTHVVRGYIGGFLERGQHEASRRPGHERLISVIREGGRNPFAREREQHAELDLFTTIPRNAEQRGAAKLIAIQEADAVITIGGFEPTYYAGLGAMYSGKRLVPVPLFGGASRELLEHAQRAEITRDPSAYGDLDGPSGSALVEKVLRLAGVGARPSIMIVHGHGDDRHELERWLGSHGDVVLMIDEVLPDKTLPRKFEFLAGSAVAAIALATPDDVGALAATPSAVVPRARQNVWLEIGWFWGRLGRDKIIVLTRGPIEIPSDYLGVERYEYTSSPLERSRELERFILSIQRQ